MSKPLGSVSRLAEVLAHLSEVIDRRARTTNEESSETSWTAKLLAAGPPLCADKVAEEGVELADAIRAESDARVASEAGDLIYHMLVGLRTRDISIDEVADVLIARQGLSGIEEKASRS